MWLTEKPQNGERNGTSAGEATTAKLEKLVSPSNTKAEQAVADRGGHELYGMPCRTVKSGLTSPHFTLMRSNNQY